MPGYLNRFIDLQFPDLAGVDDAEQALCWVRIRNPRLIPTDHLVGGGSKVRLDANGRPVDGEVAAQETYERLAKLIVAGVVWDAESLADEPPLLPMPPSAEDVKRYPIDITNAIGEELKKSTPR